MSSPEVVVYSICVMYARNSTIKDKGPISDVVPIRVRVRVRVTV